MIGTLVRDLEMKYLPSGIALVEMSLAVNGTRYDSEARSQVVTTLYCSVTVWGWQAENLANLEARRGDSVHVLGELEQREVEKAGGGKEKKTRVVAHVVTPVRVKGLGGPNPMAPSGAAAGGGSDPWA